MKEWLTLCMRPCAWMYLPQLSAPQVTHSHTDSRAPHSAHASGVRGSWRQGKVVGPPPLARRSRWGHSISGSVSALRVLRI